MGIVPKKHQSFVSECWLVCNWLLGKWQFAHWLENCAQGNNIQQTPNTSPTGYPWLRHSSHPQRSVKLYCLHDHVTTPLCKQHCECTHQLNSSSSSGFFPFFSFFFVSSMANFVMSPKWPSSPKKKEKQKKGAKFANITNYESFF